MFDWNDEELANIIWGEEGENGDHIVPYPDATDEKPPGSYGEHSKDRRDQEAANVKVAEQKLTVATTGSPEGKVGSDTLYDKCGKVPAASHGLLPNLSSSNAIQPDLEHKDEKAQVDNGSQFENQPEDTGEHDFVDYGWANIGSFDDLDKILSNDDSIFGHTNFSNAVALWSSPKDLAGCPEKSVYSSIDSPSSRIEALSSDSEHVDTKAVFMQNENQPNSCREKLSECLPHTTLSANASLENLAGDGGKEKHVLKDEASLKMVRTNPPDVYPVGDVDVAIPDESAIGKVGGQQGSLEGQKTTGEKTEARQLQSSCGPWFALWNQENQHSAMPALPRYHTSEEYNQQLPSDYDVPTGSSNLSEKSRDSPIKSLGMTPQEKIEKLRRRQQMRAMLAIRKQQQQFKHQVSCYPQFANESQTQFVEGGKVEVDENLMPLVSLDANSPVQHNCSKTIPTITDTGTMEDVILHQLEDVITTMSIQIRLCIRDSLFRLAQSSMQRQCAGETSSTNISSGDDHGVVGGEGLHSLNRSTKFPNIETETNPIDRAVAHLLFHRPLELSAKHPESLQSPSSAKIPFGRKAAASPSLPVGFLNESYKDDQLTDLSCLVTEGNVSKSPCMDTTENTSNNKAADRHIMKVEASQ